MCCVHTYMTHDTLIHVRLTVCTHTYITTYMWYRSQCMYMYVCMFIICPATSSVSVSVNKENKKIQSLLCFFIPRLGSAIPSFFHTPSFCLVSCCPYLCKNSPIAFATLVSMHWPIPIHLSMPFLLEHSFF